MVLTKVPIPALSLKLHWCNHCSKVNNQHPPLSSDLHIPSFKIQIQLVTLLKIHKKEQRKYLFLFCALTLSVIIASTDAGFGHNFYIYYSQIISSESIVICYHFQDYLNISTRFCGWVFWICCRIIPNHWLKSSRTVVLRCPQRSVAQVPWCRWGWA